jgi:hypothetical protein
MTTLAKSQPLASDSPLRSVGIWLCIILIGYIFFNVFRAVQNPAEFAAYFGTPLTTPQDTAFVLVYAIRTLFLGIFPLALLLRRSYKTLALYVLIAAILPIGDALLTASQGAPTSIVIRHILITVFLLVTGVLTQRWAAKHAA